MSKRHLKIAVISDTHLGTYGSHAEYLLNYLKSIDPEILILNGDIIDIWNFSKSYFPKSHMQVLRQILKMAERGTMTYYITGNHDEALRRYSGTKIGNFMLDDKLILDVDGQKTWIFHGDIFDATTKGWARILAKLGGKGYNILIWFNRLLNDILCYFGKEKVSFSHRVKSSVKKAVKWVSNFEEISATLAIDQKYDTVICGHIHQPQMRNISTDDGSVLYLNSGDWVENCTSLEYNDFTWQIFRYPISNIDNLHDELGFDGNDVEDDLINFSFDSIYENTLFSSSHR